MIINSKSKMDFSVVLVLTEDEARALHDITRYGYAAFIEVFKEKLGKHYISQHEKGCKSLFDTVYNEMPRHFYKMDEARKVFDGTNTMYGESNRNPEPNGAIATEAK